MHNNLKLNNFIYINYYFKINKLKFLFKFYSNNKNIYYLLII